jgi:hypothetical protein
MDGWIDGRMDDLMTTWRVVVSTIKSDYEKTTLSKKNSKPLY